MDTEFVLGEDVTHLARGCKSRAERLLASIHASMATVSEADVLEALTFRPIEPGSDVGFIAPDRTYWLEEFYQAITEMWRCQAALGKAHAAGASPEAKADLDASLAAAMKRVATAQEKLR